MKYRDITNGDKVITDLIESATGGSTSTASIASMVNPMGAINRRPSLFGYMPETPKKSKKRNKRG